MAKKKALKEITFKQTNSEGKIAFVKVAVVPTSSDWKPFPFTRAAQERFRLIESVKALVTEGTELRKKYLNDSPSITDGEMELVSDKLAASLRDRLKWVRRQSDTTLRLIESTYTSAPDSLLLLNKMLEDMRASSNGSDVREAIIFGDVLVDTYFTLAKPFIDNLRTCHPSLAREDLSELDGELIQAAKTMLRLSLSGEEDAKRLHWRNPYKGDFSSEINGARSDIISHRRYITPAFASVVIDHPESLELVMDTLNERGIPLSKADTLIEEIMTGSKPLSSGAL